jgi:hypothetical protein
MARLNNDSGERTANALFNYEATYDKFTADPSPQTADTRAMWP